jgi:superfamily II DNA or RNA helicase
MDKIILRPWQQEALEKSINFFQSGFGKTFLINVAPGAGKTIGA